MGVGALLAARVGAAPLVVDDTGRLAEPSLVLDGEGADVAADVVGGEDALPAGMDADVRGRRALRAHAIELAERAVALVDGEGGDRTTGLFFLGPLALHGVEQRHSGVEREEAGADHSLYCLHVVERAATLV